MNNISRSCRNNYNCQPLLAKNNHDKTAFKAKENEVPSVTISDSNVEKFGNRFYKACNELKGLFPYLTAKESAALIWDRMKTKIEKNPSEKNDEV